MQVAFVLINVDTGKGELVENELEKIDAINDVYALYGVHDYLVKLEADRMQDIKDIISFKIRKIDFIRSTLTLIAI